MNSIEATSHTVLRKENRSCRRRSSVARRLNRNKKWVSVLAKNPSVQNRLGGYVGLFLHYVHKNKPNYRCIIFNTTALLYTPIQPARAQKCSPIKKDTSVGHLPLAFGLNRDSQLRPFGPPLLAPAPRGYYSYYV